MTRRPKTLHLVSYLQRRREGTETFQTSRLRWIGRLDRLIQTLSESDDHPPVMLADDLALLDEYLDYRPQQRQDLGDQIAQGRLEVAPWFIVPLDMLAAPESILRNLLLGKKRLEELRSGSAIAPLSPLSSHIPQMPQILRGFGAHTVMIAGGLGDGPPAVWWEAPDGSRVLALCPRGADLGVIQSAPAQQAFKTALMEAVAQTKQAAHTSEPLVPVDDFEPDTPLVAQHLSAAPNDRRLPFLLHTGLQEYCAQLWRDDCDFPIVSGELDPTSTTGSTLGIYSARIWLKQRNRAIENALLEWAEPFSAWVSLLGASGGAKLGEPSQILAKAWESLLRNHSAAATSGAAVDEAQREIQHNFDLADATAEFVIEQSCSHLAANIDSAGLPGDPDLPVIIAFHAVDSTRRDVVACDLEIPAELDLFEVVNIEGEVQRHAVTEGPVLSDGRKQVSLIFEADNLPPRGYATFALRRASASLLSDTSDDGLEISNEFVNVTIDPHDGTVSLFDKRTGRSYNRLNQYRDGGDRGDVLSYLPPERDTVIQVPTNAPLHPERRVNNVEQVISTFQIFRLPQTLASDRASRLPLTAQFVPVSIWTDIRVANGVPRVDVDVTVANAACDHRLTAHFPTGILTHTVYADGHFNVQRHSVDGSDSLGAASDASTATRVFAQQRFVTVLGDETGLTIANAGLPEAAFTVQPDGSEIALTLLRSVGWLNRDDLPQPQVDTGAPIEIPEAQGIGEFTFSYSIIPHGGDPRPAWQEARAFQAGTRAVLTERSQGTLPASGSLVTCSNPAFVITAVKAPRDQHGLIVRGFSTSSQTERVVLELGIPLHRAEFVELDETTTGNRIKIERRRRVAFEVRPGRIVTLRLTT